MPAMDSPSIRSEQFLPWARGRRRRAGGNTDWPTDGLTYRQALSSWNGPRVGLCHKQDGSGTEALPAPDSLRTEEGVVPVDFDIETTSVVHVDRENQRIDCGAVASELVLDLVLHLGHGAVVHFGYRPWRHPSLPRGALVRREWKQFNGQL